MKNNKTTKCYAECFGFRVSPIGGKRTFVFSEVSRQTFNRHVIAVLLWFLGRNKTGLVHVYLHTLATLLNRVD